MIRLARESFFGDRALELAALAEGAGLTIDCPPDGIAATCPYSAGQELGFLRTPRALADVAETSSTMSARTAIGSRGARGLRGGPTTIDSAPKTRLEARLEQSGFTSEL